MTNEQLAQRVLAQRVLEAAIKTCMEVREDEWHYENMDVALECIGRLRTIDLSAILEEAKQVDKQELLNEIKPHQELALLMAHIQEFASMWSMVGGCFDGGDFLSQANGQKEEIRKRLTRVLGIEGEQQ